MSLPSASERTVTHDGNLHPKQEVQHSTTCPIANTSLALHHADPQAQQNKNNLKCIMAATDRRRTYPWWGESGPNLLFDVP